MIYLEEIRYYLPKKKFKKNRVHVPSLYTWFIGYWNHFVLFLFLKDEKNSMDRKHETFWPLNGTNSFGQL